jgi:hypothetical protein
MRPRDVNFTNEKTLLNTVYNKIKTFPLPKFKIGEKVRISKHKYLFEKGYTPNWTTEIFVIKNIKNTNPVTYSYILKDYQNETIQECFYEYELLKTKANIYLIQKILKQKGNKVPIR